MHTLLLVNAFHNLSISTYTLFTVQHDFSHAVTLHLFYFFVLRFAPVPVHCFSITFNVPVNNFSVMSDKATAFWVLPVLSGSKMSCSRTHGRGRFWTPTQLCICDYSAILGYTKGKDFTINITFVTVKIQSFLTDRPGQTVQTVEQSDQGLHCLLLYLHLFDKIPKSLASFLEFLVDYSKVFWRPKILELYGIVDSNNSVLKVSADQLLKYLKFMTSTSLASAQY